MLLISNAHNNAWKQEAFNDYLLILKKKKRRGEEGREGKMKRCEVARREGRKRWGQGDRERERELVDG